jgi:hypothetical protein
VLTICTPATPAPQNTLEVAMGLPSNKAEVVAVGLVEAEVQQQFEDTVVKGWG